MESKQANCIATCKGVVATWRFFFLLFSTKHKKKPQHPAQPGTIQLGGGNTALARQRGVVVSRNFYKTPNPTLAGLPTTINGKRMGKTERDGREEGGGGDGREVGSLT